MRTILQKQIEQKLKEKGLTIAALEKKAGLKSSSVKNILHGSSKKPSVYTIKAIAEFLDSSVDELVEGKSKNNDSLYSDLPWKKDLMVEICNYIDKLYKELEYSPKLGEILFVVQEIYHYSLTKNKGILDQSFAEWVLEKNIE